MEMAYILAFSVIWNEMQCLNGRLFGKAFIDSG